MVATVRSQSAEHVVDDVCGHVGRDGSVSDETPVEEGGSEQVDHELGVDVLRKGSQLRRLEHHPQQGLTSALGQ